MCGFLGFVNLNNLNKNKLLELSNYQNHRGPDSSSYYIDVEKKIYFCHKRLSIIDISNKGIQPMHSHNKRYLIMFNGEIYNFKKIKKKYLNNYRFVSLTDTEVILGLVELYGFETAITKLEGMFSIVIYDKFEE